MGRKGTPFPHIQSMAQSVPLPHIVSMLRKGTRPLSGAQTSVYRSPPLILHFNHCWRRSCTCRVWPITDSDSWKPCTYLLTYYL